MAREAEEGAADPSFSEFEVFSSFSSSAFDPLGTESPSVSVSEYLPGGRLHLSFPQNLLRRCTVLDAVVGVSSTCSRE